MTRHRTYHEDALHRTCAQFLDACLPPDAEWWHTPNGLLRNEATRKIALGLGMKPGFPDFALCYRGRLICAEAKHGRNKRSNAQVACQERLTLAGAVVLPEFRSVDELAGFLEQIIPLRGRLSA